MPQLILYSFLALAYWLIRRDIQSRQGVSNAIWIPTLWFGIIASRPVSTWVGFGSIGDTLDGSPVDRAFYLVMIIAALAVLGRRNLNWGELISRNWALVIFYGFFLISVVWANSPVSSFKRWFKEVGNIAVALVILTEARPTEAIRAVFVRCAYVLIPLSIIFIRYFPHLGRRYNMHSGELEAIGVTFQKNTLGTMVLACSLIFLWDWLDRMRGKMPRNILDRLLPPLVLGIAAWLLYLCDSKTSILSLVIGATIVTSIRLPFLRRRIGAFGLYGLIAAIAFFAFDRVFGISESIIRSMGRDMTFTGRTDVWRELFAVGTDPFIGTGYMSFWDDAKFQSKLPDWVAYSAHNGYIEIYLAGGMMGISVLAIMLLSVGARVNRGLASGSDYAAVKFAVFVMMLIANFAESNFAWMTSLGFLFTIIALGEAEHMPSAAYYAPPEAVKENEDAAFDQPAQPWRSS